ncbi:MAG: hypothetical protein EBR67_03505 [Proteobacteria bacterium]|nr:hypothetical protein [Pseudomonadota bacterium]
MVVSNTIFSNLFGGHNNVKPKSTEKQAFIDPDTDIIIEATVLKSERQPFIYTQNSQNNSERRNSEGFFTQRDNLDFPKSIFFPGITNNVAQASVSNGSFMPSRLYGNDSKYGSLSSLGSSNKKEEILGARLAFSA